MSYDGSGDENSPAPGHTVSFSVKDFLHIKEVRPSLQEILLYRLKLIFRGIQLYS